MQNNEDTGRNMRIDHVSNIFLKIVLLSRSLQLLIPLRILLWLLHFALAQKRGQQRVCALQIRNTLTLLQARQTYVF